MTDTAVRLLRDGRREGQPAPVLLLRTSCNVLGGEALFRHLLRSLVGHVQAGRAQAQGVCLVAAHRHPEDYLAYLSGTTASVPSSRTPEGGHDPAAGAPAVCRALDAFSDPLGWRAELDSLASAGLRHAEGTPAVPGGGLEPRPAGSRNPGPASAAPAHVRGGTSKDAAGPGIQGQRAACRPPRGSPVRLDGQLSGLWSAILGQLGPRGSPPSPSLVLFDSVEPLFRYHHDHPQLVFSLVEALRWEGQVSGILLVAPEDSLPGCTVAALVHQTQAVLCLRPPATVLAEAGSGDPGEEHGAGGDRGRYVPRGTGGFVELKQKRQTGRVLHMVEDFELQQSGEIVIHAARLGTVRKPQEHATQEAHIGAPQPLEAPQGAAPAPVRGAGASAAGQNLPFRLELSEEERRARAEVVLPFEHKGEGREVRIYDGRGSVDLKPLKSHLPSRTVGKVQGDMPALMGSIHYLRDSDDEEEPLDSDEDPDDDLDI